jgi:outer membrane protein
MKNWLLKIVSCLLLISALGSPAWAQGRIATVDLRKLFDNYWKTKQADAALKDRAADMEKEHKNMLDDWKKAKEDYQGLLTSANDLAVSSEERERRKKAAEDKLKYIKDTEDTISQYERQARATLDEQRRRMRDNILAEIRNVVNARAKSSGYTLVVDTAAESFNNTPVVLFSSNDNDLTTTVLDQLNAGAPADTPLTDENKEEKTETKKKDDKKKSP